MHECITTENTLLVFSFMYDIAFPYKSIFVLSP